MPADVQASWCDPTAHAQGFLHQKREADDLDITLVMSMSSAYVASREYIRGSAHELKAIVWVLGATHSGNLLRSH